MLLLPVRLRKAWLPRFQLFGAASIKCSETFRAENQQLYECLTAVTLTLRDSHYLRVEVSC